MADKRDVTTLYLRNVPARLVREAKGRAARQGSTLTAFVTDALAQSLSSEREHPSGADDELHHSVVWYERNRERLLRQFADEYVAIVEDAVIDHDKDFEALATRVFAALGVRPVFMPFVTRGEAPARVRSPRRRSA